MARSRSTHYDRLGSSNGDSAPMRDQRIANMSRGERVGTWDRDYKHEWWTKDLLQEPTWRPPRRSTRWRRFLTIVISPLVASLSLCGCGRKLEIQWEEEVPINESETVWVSRTDQFNSGGEPGNPFQQAWFLHNRSYIFEWRGQKYEYSADVQSSPGIFLIHGDGKTSLVTVVDYNTKCKKAGFAQYNLKNEKWAPQRNINSDLLGASRNLMEYYSTRGNIPKRLSLQAKEGLHLSSPRKRQSLNVLSSDSLAENCQIGE